MEKNKQLIILVGNIGSGKTTLTEGYVKKGFIVIARDQLRYAIGNGEYIFNYDYEPIIWDTELYLYSKFLKLGVNIIIDEVGINKEMRSRYIKKAKKKGYTITAIEMPKLSMKESVNRRMINPHSQPIKKVWEEVWKKFNKQYEELSLEEGFDNIIKIRSTDGKKKSLKK